MDSVTQGYTPLDLQAILKGLPKNFKKINTDKELENETAEICVVLKDLSKSTNSNLYSCSNRLEKAARSMSKNLSHCLLV